MIKILAIDDLNNYFNSLKAIIIENLPDSLISNTQDGKQIKKLAKDGDPDVILMNLNDDFIGICSALKKDKKLNIIPIVFICPDQNDQKKRLAAMNAGADAFLKKTADKVEFLTLMKSMKKIKEAQVFLQQDKLPPSAALIKKSQKTGKRQIGTVDLPVGINTLKSTEQLLYKSEQGYRNLFEANPHPMYIYNLESLKFLEVNEKAVQHYGYSREEFQNMTICDIRPKEDVERLLKKVKDAGSGLRNVGLWRHIKKDKQIIWVQITSHPIMWQGQQAVAILAHDITERKLTEEDLKTALQQLEFHENNSPLAVIEFNEKFQITKWSKNAESIFGWSAEEVLGKSIGEFKWVHEEDAQRVASLSAAMVASQKTSNSHTNRNYTKQGTIITCEWYNSAMIGADGKLISVHSLVMDITDRQQAGEALNVSNEFNKTLLQAIPFAMQIVDENGDVLFVNEIMEKTFGIKTKVEKCWALFNDSISKCRGCALLSDLKIGETTTRESFDLFEDKIFQISHTGMLFNGRKALLEIFQDITERKKIEAELINAKERAEESDQLKTSFLANMSHEIRTPLNSIIGFSEMLTDPDYDSSQQFHIARIIQSSGNNLLTVINNILDISKIEAGQVQIVRKLFTVNKLLADIEKQYLFKSIERGIDFIVDIPNPVLEISILSDESKIRQVLDNFISNSLKFTKRGSIHIGFNKHEDCIEFMVKDTGIGIPVEFHEKIFERFRQVEAVNTKTHGGNGLGLAISKGLVQLLGGNIWMESEKGKGSTFYFSIPQHF